MNRPEGSVLVINAGSSSLKYQLLQPDSGVVSAKGLIEQIGEGGGQHRHWVAGDEQVSAGGLTNIGAALAALRAAFARHGPDLQAHPPIAVGHRVVHGGTRFERTTRIDESVLAGLRELNPLAPLHNPANITAPLTSTSRAGSPLCVGDPIWQPSYCTSEMGPARARCLTDAVSRRPWA